MSGGRANEEPEWWRACQVGAKHKVCAKPVKTLVDCSLTHSFIARALQVTPAPPTPALVCVHAPDTSACDDRAKREAGMPEEEERLTQRGGLNERLKARRRPLERGREEEAKGPLGDDEGAGRALWPFCSPPSPPASFMQRAHQGMSRMHVHTKNKEAHVTCDM